MSPSKTVLITGATGGIGYATAADLAEDLGETRNLWTERPDVVERLTGMLESVVR